MKRSTTCFFVLSMASLLFISAIAGMALFPPKTYGSADDGKNITANVGEVFRVSLPENPTTGYSWDIKTSEGLVRLNDKYVSADRSGMRVGVGGTHTWEYKATKPGLQTLSGIYKRPWENVTGSEETYQLQVNVVEGGFLSRLFRLPAPLLKPGTMLRR